MPYNPYCDGSVSGNKYEPEDPPSFTLSPRSSRCFLILLFAVLISLVTLISRGQTFVHSKWLSHAQTESG